MNSIFIMEFAEAYADILLDANKPHLISAKFEAVRRLNSIINSYCDKGIRPEFVKVILDKKIEYIKGATTQDDLKEILKPSTPRWNYAEFVPTTRYHIEQEELILWSLVSMAAPLNDDANQRYIYLGNKYIGKYIN